MKAQLKEKLWGLKLNIKFTIIIVAFVLVVTVIFFVFAFSSMETTALKEKKNNMDNNMESRHEQISKYVDFINMSAQFFLSDKQLSAYLSRLETGGDYTTSELMEFYNVNIASLERVVNNNPYLYQVRVYADSKNLQEMMPILYRRDRMNNLKWSEDEPLFGWKFDYLDTIFELSARNENQKLISLVTPIKDYTNKEIGILEVAMPMETMFPDIYQNSEGKWNCFIDENGNRYYGEKVDKSIDLYFQEIQEKYEGKNKLNESHHEVMNRQSMVIGYMPVKELSGTLICIDSMEKEINRIHGMRNVFLILVILIMGLLAVVINIIVKALLKQFYEILHSIREVQSGDLDVVIPNCGNDEMGELGIQINTMLSRIKLLMEDNIKRELLAKNSELRALQNQINAHFLYNVLESIKMMAEIDEEYEISDAITALGKLLRYSMKWTSNHITVRDEVEYIKNYLKLINLRFDFEIYLSLNIPDIIYRQKIPKMSLQPIVENAIYHGIEQMAEDTNIYIKGFVEDKDCLIEITDAGKGMSEEEVKELYRKISGEIETSGGSGNGIGLKNVQDRIRMNFGEEYGIEIASKQGCYTKIMVRIPLQEGEECI